MEKPTSKDRQQQQGRRRWEVIEAVVTEFTES